jgi:hypothetical protein
LVDEGRVVAGVCAYLLPIESGISHARREEIPLLWFNHHAQILATTKEFSLSLPAPQPLSAIADT